MNDFAPGSPPEADTKPSGKTWQLAVHLAVEALEGRKSPVEIALIYAGFGIAVVPAKPTPKDVPYCSIEKDFKAPLTSHGGKDATTDEELIRKWWSKWPGALIWAQMGERAGVFVIDVDALGDDHPYDGVAEWEKLEQEYGATATRTHKTPSGGFHRLYLWRDDRPIRGKRGNLPDGIDVRGETQGIILPGSQLEDGRTWTVGEDWEPKAAPTWLLDILLPETGKKPHGGKRAGAGRKRKERSWPAGYAEARLDTAIEALLRRESTECVLQIGSLVAAGALDEEMALTRLLEAGAIAHPGDSAHQEKIRRRFDHGKQSPSEPPAWKPGEADEEGYLLNAQGNRPPILPNLLVGLRTTETLKGAFAFDQFNLRVTVTKPVATWLDARDVPKHLEDPDETPINNILQRQGLLAIHKRTLHDAIVEVAMENRFHPVRDYLDGLKWDGKPRVKTWLHTYLGVKNNEYSQTIGPMFLLQMVARVFEPGCKGDYILVLEGPEGIMKSWALETLAGAWFSDDLPDIRSKDAKVHLAGKWLIELGELVRMIRADPAAFKSFVTSLRDKYRPPYGSNETIQLRQCVFAGTTNLMHYFDEDLNRRIWPVLCGQINLAGLKEDRDQLFAETMVMFLDNAPRHPDHQFEREVIVPEQRARIEIGAFDEKVAIEVRYEDTVTLGQVSLKLGTLNIGEWTALQKSLARSLRRLGWEPMPRERVDGGLVRKWQRGKYAMPKGQPEPEGKSGRNQDSPG